MCECLYISVIAWCVLKIQSLTHAFCLRLILFLCMRYTNGQNGDAYMWYARRILLFNSLFHLTTKIKQRKCCFFFYLPEIVTKLTLTNQIILYETKSKKDRLAMQQQQTVFIEEHFIWLYWLYPSLDSIRFHLPPFSSFVLILIFLRSEKKTEISTRIYIPIVEPATQN